NKTLPSFTTATTAPAMSSRSSCAGRRPSRKAWRSVAVSSGALGGSFRSEVLAAGCDFAEPCGAGPWPGVSEADRHEASSSVVPVRMAVELINVNKRILLKKCIGPATLSALVSNRPNGRERTLEIAAEDQFDIGIAVLAANQTFRQVKHPLRV